MSLPVVIRPNRTSKAQRGLQSLTQVAKRHSRRKWRTCGVTRRSIVVQSVAAVPNFDPEVGND